MLQFPLYLAAKQAGSRLEDLSQVEATSLAVYLDVTGKQAVSQHDLISLEVFTLKAETTQVLNEAVWHSALRTDKPSQFHAKQAGAGRSFYH